MSILIKYYEKLKMIKLFLKIYLIETKFRINHKKYWVSIRNLNKHFKSQPNKC